MNPPSKPNASFSTYLNASLNLPRAKNVSNNIVNNDGKYLLYVSFN